MDYDCFDRHQINPAFMIDISHINVTLVGFGNVGKCVLNVMLQDHHRSFNINILDPDPNISGSLRDLGHACMLAKRHEIIWNSQEAFESADFIIFCAGRAIPIGANRSFALDENRKIVQDVFHNFKAKADPILIVVSNPVDVISLEILQASKLNPENILGIGTIVETLRLTHQLSLVSGIPPSEIDTLVIGEHGETMVPLISNTFIKGIPVSKYLEEHLIRDCIYETRRAAHRIKETQHAAFYAAANAVIHVFQSILTQESNPMPLSIYHEEDGVFYSVPIKVTKGGNLLPIVLSIDTDELEALEESKQKIRLISGVGGAGVEMSQVNK